MRKIILQSIKFTLVLSIVLSNIFFLLPSQTLAVVVNGTGTPPPTNIPPVAGTDPQQPFNVTSNPPANTANPAIINSVIPTYTNDRWSESTLRSQFNQYGIDVNNGVQLYGLGNFAVTGAVSLKKTVDYYTSAVRVSSVPLSNLTVTAGTDTYNTDQPVLDITSNPNLDYFINHLATSRGSSNYGQLYQLGDDYFFQNNNSWHIIFGPSNGAFVKNTINFFGIVRDNFAVPHPVITDTNTPSVVSFPRNLGVGTKGQDVHDLQQLLNADSYTTVASTGDGSPGHETQYFGVKTQDAVKRYQYKDNEILDAAAITTPTGFFGTFSRAAMASYGNYLNALKNNQNRATLAYPTPTKPLEDIPLNGNAPVSNPNNGTPNNNPAPATPISLNTTPTAPTYNFTNGPPNPYASTTDPYAPLPPDPTLNNTPVFDQPNYVGIQDPNIAVNQTPNSSQPTSPSSINQYLPTIFSVMQMLQRGGFSLPGLGGAHAPGAGGAPAASGLPDYGGKTSYNSFYFKSDPYRPCGCSAQETYLIINDNSRSSTRTPSPIVLLQTQATSLITGPLMIGACAIGKYLPPTACSSWVLRGNVNVCQPGPGDEFPWAIPFGTIKTVESQSNSCSQ